MGAAHLDGVVRAAAVEAVARRCGGQSVDPTAVRLHSAQHPPIFVAPDPAHSDRLRSSALRERICPRSYMSVP